MKSVEDIRRDFPILKKEINGYPLAYFDSAASSLKPKVFVDAVSDYYLMGASNVHRGVHQLSEEATKRYEATRGIVQSFINAREEAEVVFTSGTTDSINRIARGVAQYLLKSGDEIIVSELEHHSNIVPWQMAAEKVGAKVKVIPLHGDGALDIEQYQSLLSNNVKLVAVNHVSNSLGTINPIKDMVKAAHAVGAQVVVDGAQAVAHLPVDVQDLGCDYYCFSGHKIFSSTGTGILYGRREVLEKLPPDVGGGDMIEKVSFSGTTYAELPARLEAGTPNIAGFIGLGVSLEYVNEIGFDYIQSHENEIYRYAYEQLSSISDLHVVGVAEPKIAVLSFVIDGIHAHDLGSVLDMKGIAVRTGHHCTMPAIEKLGVAATTRASFSIFNTKGEVDRLKSAIESAREMFL